LNVQETQLSIVAVRLELGKILEKIMATIGKKFLRKNV
jgi:hypothetical protein